MLGPYRDGAQVSRGGASPAPTTWNVRRGGGAGEPGRGKPRPYNVERKT
jgi:hypothetical protein